MKPQYIASRGGTWACAAFVGCFMPLSTAALAGTTGPERARDTGRGPLTSGSASALHTFCDDPPLNDYVVNTPDIRTDPSKAGYVVDLVVRGRGVLPAAARPAALVAPSSSMTTATVTSVPLPSAAILFPFTFAIAVYMGRRMQSRRG